MPTTGSNDKDWWKRLKVEKEAYRQKLIAKGVVDGGSKMMKLMSNKF